VNGLGSDSDDHADGDNSADADFHVPQLITTLLGERVRAIAAGCDMSCAVTDAGALYTWGRNADGVLGHGDVHRRRRPTLVEGLQGIRVVGVSISLGVITHSQHALALSADGSVYSFGQGFGLGIGHEGEGEEVGDGPRTPQRIPNLTCMVLR
jgi:alpha-tubulin suppressor-like RCC1 family protein